MHFYKSTRTHGPVFLLLRLDLEAFVVVTSRITHPFMGAGLRVIYLVEWVHCQLVGEDAPQVPMDLPGFMLALLSITNAEYAL